MEKGQLVVDERVAENAASLFDRRASYAFTKVEMLPTEHEARQRQREPAAALTEGDSQARGDGRACDP
jgi:hypothetical protein